MLVCEGSLCPIKLPEVSGSGLEEAERYRMVSETTLAVSRARTGIWVSALASGMRRWHWTHGRDTGTIGTGCTDVAHWLLALDVRDVAKIGSSWLGIDRRGRRFFKGVSM